MIICEEILRKSSLNSYSEFYLALTIARECMRQGLYFNMSSMSIDKDKLPDSLMGYFKYLVYKGNLVIDGLSPEFVNKPKDYYLDTTPFNCVNVLKDDGNCYKWDFDYAYSNYTGDGLSLLSARTLGGLMLHVVGYYLLNTFLGKLEKKPLIISVPNRQHVMSTYLYINVLSCLRSIPWLNECISLEIDYVGYSIDVDYSIFCNNSIVAKHNVMLSWKDKVSILKKNKMVEGSILVLWERAGMNPSNPIGRITNSSLVRVDKIENDMIYMTSIPVFKTKEEIVYDYYEIPEDRRYLFHDILNFNINCYQRNYPLVNLGVRDYINSEDTVFIELIDGNNTVSKKVTIDGTTDYVTMSELDAIYWLLCQFDIMFDAKLFKDMYNNGEDLLWDKYN